MCIIHSKMYIRLIDLLCFVLKIDLKATQWRLKIITMWKHTLSVSLKSTHRSCVHANTCTQIVKQEMICPKCMNCFCQQQEVLWNKQPVTMPMYMIQTTKLAQHLGEINNTRRESALSTDIRSNKKVVLPTWLEHSPLSLVYNQPGTFSEWKLTKRKWSWTIR